MKGYPLNNIHATAGLKNPRMEWFLRWMLGVVLIYSSWHKVLEPLQFAKILYQYQIFPAPAISLIAIIVPFLQLTVGTALLLGIYPRSAALLCDVMLLLFTVTLAVNILRGHQFDCGCFNISGIGGGTSPKISILRNLVLLIMGIYVTWFPARRWGCLKPGVGDAQIVIGKAQLKKS